ncbi:hypothetical protein OIU78_017767 [Salix suchowensis]|nr:hypothetical protein OIU78_017767 [Salix suchowensis]
MGIPSTLFLMLSRGSNFITHTFLFSKSIGIKSPIPYRWRKVVGIEHWKNGMNFAYGGTGVFPIVDVPEPNMTTQIDFFQDIIHEKFYSGSDLHSSVALVSVAGNDYSNYIATNGSPQVTFDH